MGSPRRKRGVCDCAHHRTYHWGGGVGPCDYLPDPLVSECPCTEFRETQEYDWSGPDAKLAETLAWLSHRVPGFFIFESEGTRNVLFDAPYADEFPPASVPYRVWCRTADVPADLAPLAVRAHGDDAAAMVYLDALLERGLARAVPRSP